MEILRQLDAAKRSFRGEPRFCWRQASPLKVILEETEVRCHLARQVWLSASRTNDVVESQEKSPQ